MTLLGPVSFDVLQAMIQCDRMMSARRIAFYAGYTFWETTSALDFLRSLELVKRHMPKYIVTERGRIAWALEAARQNRKLKGARG